MKEILKQYASYNLWANQRLIDVVLSLPEELQTKKITSSFDSLYATVLHIWDAESGWWQRMKLQERVIFPSDQFTGSTKDLTTGLLQQSKQWEEWVQSASDLTLEHVFAYQNTKKELIKMPVYQMLQHVFNHGSYHRGQLVMMLRQLDVSKIPATDFSVWSRKRSGVTAR